MPKSGDNEEKKVTEKQKRIKNKKEENIEANIDMEEKLDKKATNKKKSAKSQNIDKQDNSKKEQEEVETVSKTPKTKRPKKNAENLEQKEETTISKSKKNNKDVQMKNQQDELIDQQNLSKETNTFDNASENSLPESKNTKMIHTVKNEFHTLEVVVLIILTCVISLAVGGLLGLRFNGNDFSNNQIEIVDKELQEFIQDYHYLIKNYYGNIDKKELLNTAFKSMIDTLEDTYSGNIDENSSNNFDIQLRGSYEGLGVEIINDSDKNILIYRIVPNSPASKVDMKAGDKIISVNGRTITNLTTTAFINTIVKPNDSKKFSIELERDGKKHTVEIKKENIVLESVVSKKYIENNKNIGYIKVDIFAENTYEQFKSKLETLEKEGIDSLIIDLRDNNGGHLATVSDMISLFLDSSHIIYRTESNKKQEKIYSTGKITKKYPIVILGNGSSASASEVMIGALTEEYGAVLIGNKTFGKGTVQELHQLSNGDEYKFTTKKWLTPKGVWVHDQGITPKVEVILSERYYENPSDENDNQLRVALDYLTGKR